MSFGDYTKTTYQYGVTAFNPATWQSQEDKVNALDGELAYSKNYRFNDLKKYFWNVNCKEIHMFNDDTDWATIGTATISTLVNPRTGDEDVAFVESDNTGSVIGMDDSITSIDLTEFNSGDSSTTSDVICFAASVSDHTMFSQLEIKLGDDNANYYSETFTVTETGRAVFQAKKSAFSTTGAPTGWDDITYVAIEATTENLAINEFIGCFALMLYRNSPDNDGEGQPFQEYKGSVTGWTSFLTQETDLWFLFFDPSKNDLGIQFFNDQNDSTNYDTLHVACNTVSFVWKSIMYCKNDNYTNSMCWYVDANNYATCYVDIGDFTLKVTEAGSPTTYTSELTNSLWLDERIVITLEKNTDTIRATLEKGNEKIIYLEHETTISSTTDGCLYFGHNSTTGNSFIVDWMISNVNNMDLDNWDKPKIVMKLEDESKSNDATLDDDDELWAYLPPNSLFEAYLSLVYISTSATPDIKVDWSITGDVEFITGRQAIGVPTNITDANDSNVRITEYGRTIGVAYGLEGGTDESIAREWVVLKTGVNGGEFAIRWSQNTSYGTATIVKAGSFVKITKLDVLMQNRNN